METEKLIIASGDGEIGREVCRLAVAMGHEVVSVSIDGRAPNVEPWTKGVRWIRGDVGVTGKWEEELSNAYALVVTDGVADDYAVVAAKAAGVEQTVVSVTGMMQSTSRALAVARYHATTLDDVPSDDTVIHVSQLAMALLRIALENHRGVLQHDRLVFLGDAMMIQ